MIGLDMETLGVVVAQVPVSLEVEPNVDLVRRACDSAQAGDLVVAPEGVVSGYSGEMGFLARLSPPEIDAALEDLGQLAEERQLTLCVGTCLSEDGAWSNAAVLLGPTGVRQTYRKTNLATAERGSIHPGDHLTVFTLGPPSPPVRVGVQICRELRFPEQWRVLAEAGAQVLLHLNNASGEGEMDSVWRSHLISRAAENQRFVVSVNNPGPQQASPSIVVHPTGRVLAELPAATVAVERVELALADVGDYYLSQQRRDLMRLGRDLAG
jgi:omega-amidase